MSSVFSIALSSLQAESEAISTTGSNLANLNTTGFKGNQVDFKDLFSQSLGSAAGGLDVGLGVGLPVNDQLFTQGAIQTSSSPLACAVQGNGFFVVTSPSNNQQLFTRDGNFTQDATGVLRTQTGEAVQGWTATAAGVVDTTNPTGNIILPTGATLPPVATQNFSIQANLDAQNSAGGTGTFSAPMQVVDSLGNTHNLTVTFTQSATTANTWTYDVTIPGGDLTGGTAGTQQSLLATPGTVTFTSGGQLSTAGGTAPVAINISGLADGAANMNINWNLFNSSGQGLLTQYAQASNLSASQQDGHPAAELTSIGIQTGGQIMATYSDGQQKVVAQLALAGISNPTSLLNVGDNNYALSGASAVPALGPAQSGGRGQILGGSLESSNVDMATQFTNLIVYQSAYQASSRVISTANNMNQDLMQLIH